MTQEAPLPPETSPPPAAPPMYFCANHPTRETSLRCNRCEKPICSKCAVLTPTGYRCKECVHGQAKIFETAKAQDYFVAAGIGGVLAFLGSLLLPRLGFFVILVAPIAGGIIAEAIRFGIQRRRAKRLFQVAAGAVAAGSLLPVCVSLAGFILVAVMGADAGGMLRVGFSFIWTLVYTFMVVSTVYYRLAGIEIKF